jgi:PLP dependent protein
VTKPQDARSEELAGNLARVRERIWAACAASQREPEEVTVVAITKTWPASDVAALAELGVRDVGENREQELRGKVAECADLDVRWHFVGQLQRNKAQSVVRACDVVQSVDRAPLATALDRAADAAGKRLGVCIQVDLDGSGDHGPGGRGGALPGEVPALAELIEAAEHLDLLGVMAVAPLGVDSREPFERLAGVHERLMADVPTATMRSAGMSGDLEAAISCGATHIRLGSALLGHRRTFK